MMEGLFLDAIYILVAVAFISWIARDIFLLRKNKKIEHDSNVYRLNIPDREKRLIRSMYEHGDYRVVNEYLHHYEFIIDDEPVILGIVSIAGIIEDLNRDQHHNTNHS